MVVLVGGALGTTSGMVESGNSGAENVATITCHSSWLTSKIGRTGAETGTTYTTLEIVNHSGRACTLSGIPTAQPGFITYGMPSFEPVGPPAGAVSYAGRGKTVVIRAGKVASVEFAISTAANYPRHACAPRTISNVDVTFHVGRMAVKLGYPLPSQAVCTKLDSTSIYGIVLGTHFP